MKTQKIFFSLFIISLSLTFLAQGCSKKENQEFAGLYGKNSISLDVNKSIINWTVHRNNGTIQGTMKFSKGLFKMEKGMPVSGACSIDMNSIKIENMPDSAENKQLTEYLKSDLFFNAKKYPEALFSISSILPLRTPSKPDVNTTVKSSLTIKDSTLSTGITALTRYYADSISSSAKFSLNGATWNIPLSKIKSGNNNKENPFKEDFDIEVFILAK